MPTANHAYLPLGARVAPPTLAGTLARSPPTTPIVAPGTKVNSVVVIPAVDLTKGARVAPVPHSDSPVRAEAESGLPERAAAAPTPPTDSLPGATGASGHPYSIATLASIADLTPTPVCLASIVTRPAPMPTTRTSRRVMPTRRVARRHTPYRMEDVFTDSEADDDLSTLGRTLQDIAL